MSGQGTISSTIAIYIANLGFKHIPLMPRTRFCKNRTIPRDVRQHLVWYKFKSTLKLRTEWAYLSPKPSSREED